jgi:hypothetical protein
MFYNIDDVPIPVLKSRIGHIYNNVFFNNDSQIRLYSEPQIGATLTNITTEFFGAFDLDASTIISAIGVTSEFQKRLVDTHIKDLKSLNALQANFFVYNDLINSVIKELHPMIGNTFNQVKYNWIKATDEDSSHRLSAWTGTPKVIENAINFINSEGVLLQTYSFDLHTNFNAYSTLGVTNSFSYYSIFNISDWAAGYNEMGAIKNTSPYSGIEMTIRRDATIHAISDNTFQVPNKGVQYAEIDSKGYYIINKLANDDLKGFKNGTQIGNTVSDAGASVYYNGDICLGNRNILGTPQAAKQTPLPCAYYHIGNAIASNVLKPFNDAVMRLCSSKNFYYFPPEETAIA